MVWNEVDNLCNFTVTFAVNNVCSFIFYVTGVKYEINWYVKYLLYFSDRAACTIKVNIKKIFIRNGGLLHMIIFLEEFIEKKKKDLLLEKISI